jgi:serine/threonine protein kinase
LPVASPASVSNEATVSKATVFKDKYTLGSVLGQGSYSVVKLGTRISDGKKVAVKIVSRNRLQREDELSLRIEVEVLMSLNHPNIVQALDFFEEEEHFYVVLEYLEGGELFERLIEKAVYTEGEARDLFVILLKAVKYCHDRDLIHRFVLLAFFSAG